MTALKYHQLTSAQRTLDDINQKITLIEIGQKNLIVIVQKIILDFKIQTNM